LTVIGGYVESMQEGTLPATPARLDTIYKEVQHLHRLVEDLRTLSLAETGQLSLNATQIPPQALLEQVEAAYRLSAQQKGIELLVEGNTGIPEIRVDPDRMMQVLSNLVSNALRHTPTGGEIRLQCAVENQQSAASRYQSNISDQMIPEHNVLITIQDNGDGIPTEVLPHIFDRFYRGDQARQEGDGESGLGLAIANSIVDMHGGELLVHSEGKGKGSKFSIRIHIM
jgi:signal transduction histidine kinase